MKLSNRLVVVTVLVLVLLGGATWAWAQTDGQIKACVKEGKVTALGLADQVTCDVDKEEPLVWNIQGPQGEPGCQDCESRISELEDLVVCLGPCNPARVPKTGQRTEYAQGDDGDLQKGVVWPDPRFTDNGNGTVTDHLTGLMWLKKADCFETGTWEDALSDANTLNSGECDLNDGSVEGDWRLPNVRELQSLIDYGLSGPALPSGHPFTGVKFETCYYWSSTTAAGTTNAWVLNMFTGNVFALPKSDTNYVWPVRGGQ